MTEQTQRKGVVSRAAVMQILRSRGTLKNWAYNSNTLSNAGRRVWKKDPDLEYAYVMVCKHDGWMHFDRSYHKAIQVMGNHFDKSHYWIAHGYYTTYAIGKGEWDEIQQGLSLVELVFTRAEALAEPELVTAFKAHKQAFWLGMTVRYPPDPKEGRALAVAQADLLASRNT